MFIDKRISPKRGVDPLLFDENKTYDAFSYTQPGPQDIGGRSKTTTPVYWTIVYEVGQSRFYINASTGLSYTLLSGSLDEQVTQVSFCFNHQNQVVWAYSYTHAKTYASGVKLFIYDKVKNKQVVHVPNSSSPTLTLDFERSVSLEQVEPSALLFYVKASTKEFCLRQSDDEFSVETVLGNLQSDEFLIKSGRTQGKRVQVTTRRRLGQASFKAALTVDGGYLLDANGNPLWLTLTKG